MKAQNKEKEPSFEDDKEMFFSASDDEILSCFGEPGYGAGALEASLLSRITEVENQLY